MITGGDVLTLYALIESPSDWTLRSLASRLGAQHSKVQRGIDSLSAAGIYDRDRARLVPHAVDEFLLHALKYLHPVVEGASARGVPTAWGAEPLLSEITTDGAAPVWPDPRGHVRGPSVQPLDPRLPSLVADWPEVARLASLGDALVLGDARVRDAAARHLTERLRGPL